MSVNCQATSAIADWPMSEPAPVTQRGIGSGTSLPRPVATAFRKTRQMLAVLRAWHQRPTGNGGPEVPWEDPDARDSIWDDPMLWVLIMMH
jgi:hypothetical protein